MSCSPIQYDFVYSILINTSTEMVAQNSADFSIFRGHSRQRGRGSGALAQTHGRTSIPFIEKYAVRVAKTVGQHLFEIAAPEIEVVSGRKSFKHLHKKSEQKQFEII